MPLNEAMLSGAGAGAAVGGGAGAGDDYGDEYGEEGEEGAGGMPAGANPFAALASNPNFGMIRQRILQDPNFYNQFMQQLAQSQPQLFQLIQANPGAFMNLILGGDPNAGVPLGGGAGQGHAHGGPGGANPPGTIRVTQEEMEAINRLTQLGFPKHKAAEAYFACDKNEEMAANFLFESGFEDEDAAL
jgi:UV excision repair protein RAD23